MPHYMGYETNLDLDTMSAARDERFSGKKGRIMRFNYMGPDFRLVMEQYPITPTSDQRAAIEKPDALVVKDDVLRIVFPSGIGEVQVYSEVTSKGGFTRGQVLDLIGDLFREIHRIEGISGDHMDAFEGQGVFGLAGRDITGFFIEEVRFHRDAGKEYCMVMPGT